MNSTLVWLREDLRLLDNPALVEAAKVGNPVTIVFILDEVSEGFRENGGASRWWLHRSLESLSADMAKSGMTLTLRRGSAAVLIPDLVAETGATSVFWNRRYGQAERELDSRLKAQLREGGVRVESYQAGLLYEPWTLQTGAGKPYSVFTPFYRASLSKLTPRSPLPAPSGLADLVSQSAAILESDELSSWQLLPTHPNWAGGLEERWSPGERGAHERLDEFLDQRIPSYADGRNFPARESTSELSAHLRWGEISPFQVWHAVDAKRSSTPEVADAATAFIRELVWREFSYNLLFYWPNLSTENFNRKFDDFPWREPDDAALDAWKTGNTGVPIVDAGMRELWHTGSMHNRVRMIVASFLTKNLMIDWRIGERWFWDTLVDADPANNPASWQWVAGCGADAAPYFRVFNPELQAQKFDPDAAYIGKWVPEAVSIEAAFEAGYAPIVDLRASRAEALEAYQRMKLRNEMSSVDAHPIG